ncbi:hypothetical protein P7266_0152 [Lactococcus cremoris]|nr:hypothetical protein P7266_0152 [Lactococcus cremoris]
MWCWHNFFPFYYFEFTDGSISFKITDRVVSKRTLLFIN